ncbi:LacI family transcriptional regulator [Pedobacter sp. CAN_A7]|uniref:LacI family DNA-binding transcriptional regulator n=1 Tax=Pedobacter sp. CAN_A7 TaxID=2787722 RepID=UPI0018C9264E
MSTKAPSIKDIAKIANVSITTVSFIINGKAVEKNISTAVIKRVEEIILAQGYQPNQIARSLRTGNSKIIALMVEDISNPFFAGIARLIEEKAYKKGYKIIYSSTESDAVRTNELIQLFRSRQVDAYIISPVQGTEKIIKELIDEGKPVVLFDRHLPTISANYVGVDHFKASYDAIAGFIAMNLQNIALVTVDLDVEQITDRHAGYQQALADHHITYNESLVLKVPFKQPRNETINQLVELFKVNETIDAVLFATNYLAISGLSALRSMNKLVNDSFKVIAYDDGDVFKLHSPQISAVEQPLEEIADNIIKLIFQQLASTTEITPEKIILPAKLIIR